MARLSLRRTRVNRHLAKLSREVRLHREQLIQPLFVVEGLTEAEPVPGLREVNRDTPDSLMRQVEADLAAGIDKFLLFGVPGDKHERNFDYAFTAAQIRALKRRFADDIWLAVDVCLCSYTRHGHCGLLNDSGDAIDNAASVDELARAAAVYAQAGADCVAPSDMMDGRVAAIRAALDDQGDDAVAIMSYSAKFASAFYGPFRTAADSAPARNGRLTDRCSYQLDPARRDDALRCAERDRQEGADVLMLKPALPCLDLLPELIRRSPLPWAVYQTSGEQAGIDAAAAAGLLDADRAQLETWIACLRAGARMIISYAARRPLV
jgi:porphobilinogen synthase